MDGLWEFPDLESGGDARLESLGRLGSVRHLVTFRTIDVAVHRARLEGRVPAGWRWVTPAGLERLPTSSLVGKALALRNGRRAVK
jgi:hypothetical protein